MSSAPKAGQSVKKMRKRLSSYAAIAAAAGTATATNCEASIVVHDLGDVTGFALDVDIDGGAAGGPGLVAGADVFLRGDSYYGVTTLSAQTTSGGGVASEFLDLYFGEKAFALQLSPSTNVGPEIEFSDDAILTQDIKGFFSYGNWDSPTRGFLGVQFLIGADIHFGWIDLSINDDWSLTAHRAAYNDVPGEPVHVEDPAPSGAVPEPASGIVWLTTLAAGATGVHAFRKRVADQQAA